jgi:hypothetical protein
MEATRASETSFHFQQTIRRYTPEYSTVQHYSLVHFYVKILNNRKNMKVLKWTESNLLFDIWIIFEGFITNLQIKMSSILVMRHEHVLS